MEAIAIPLDSSVHAKDKAKKKVDEKTMAGATAGISGVAIGAIAKDLLHDDITKPEEIVTPDQRERLSDHEEVTDETILPEAYAIDPNEAIDPNDVRLEEDDEVDRITIGSPSNQSENEEPADAYRPFTNSDHIDTPVTPIVVSEEVLLAETLDMVDAHYEGGFTQDTFSQNCMETMTVVSVDSDTNPSNECDLMTFIG